MSAGTKPVGEVIVDVWNVGHALGKGARLGWQLRRLTKTADVIGLLEAARFTRAIRLALGRRWHVYRAHHPGADRSSDVLVLVHRSRVPRPSIRTIGHAAPWRGPKAGIRHRGRSWPVLEWPDLKLVIVHRTPGGPSGGTSARVKGANLAAWSADLDVLRDELNEWPRDQARALLGDQNAKRGELDEYVNELYLRVRYVIGVDHGATDNLESTRAEVMPKAGSDHHRIRWTLRTWARSRR